MGHQKSKLVVKDHGFAALMKRAKDIASIKGAGVKVGVLADDSKGGLHQKGADGKAAKLTVAEIFAVLNFGTRDGKIPPRPVMTTVFDAKRDELKAMGARLIADVIVGNMDLDTALNMLGARLAADVKAAIVAGFPPPNAPSTALAKAKRGRTKALFRESGARGARGLGRALAQVGAIAAVKTFIDTGRLLGAITWKIER